MAGMCERPGCSEPGAAAYGMTPEDLLFWIAPLDEARSDGPSVLCRRHADAMVVPRGWTLDDRREETLRLFKPRPVEQAAGSSAAGTARSRRARPGRPEQLQIDGTGEIARPTEIADGEPVVEVDEQPTPETPWQPDFDAHDDLGGLLEVDSPLLARAFRGTGRPRG